MYNSKSKKKSCVIEQFPLFSGISFRLRDLAVLYDLLSILMLSSLGYLLLMICEKYGSLSRIFQANVFHVIQ